MTTSTLPTESRPIRMDPELAEEVEKLVKAVSGPKREAAQAAVMKVYQSGAAGSFAEVVEAYRAAIKEAVG